MKRLLLVMGLALLGGCYVSDAQIEGAIEVCENNGGLNKLDVGPTIAHCKNGARFTIED